jgi:hypothetical protein
LLQVELLEERVLLTVAADNAAFVAQVCQNLLYRGRDSAGRANWANSLANAA